MSWGEWLASVQHAYDMEEIMEAQVKAGAVLTPEEERLLRTWPSDFRYGRDGRSKLKNTKQRS